jgi:hypothetical protein
MTSPNSSGFAVTFTESGSIDQTNPFFKPFGNGRSCASCHQQSDGWSLTPASVQEKFNRTGGMDPLFVSMDGANSPLADISTIDARRTAYSMLMSKGLIRIGLPVPPDAEFELVRADDPYGYASSAELSLFRRPLPATNLKFLAAVMWDTRETYKDANSGICFAGTVDCYSALDFNLGNQASHAVSGHAQAANELTPDEQTAVVEFEKGLFTAQAFDNKAKSLTGAGGKGGPLALSKTEFYFGINDSEAGDYRTKAPFTSHVMSLYDAWKATSISLADSDTPPSDAADVTSARQAVVRGQTIFNGRPIFINNVGGLKNASVRGTCTTCHNAPDAGSHATPLTFNIGLDDAARRSADMPLYTLKNKATGETIQTMDPGAALLTGKWQDVGRFKVPVLRALASRAPYFHNGSAKDIGDVLEFYNVRFKMGLTAQDASDLAAFLKAL